MREMIFYFFQGSRVLRKRERPFPTTFTILQAGLRSMEYQALPGPETRALRAKIMRHVSVLGSGGPCT
jgi:hypothetical protein